MKREKVGFDIKLEDELFLSVPSELKDLEKDEFGMVKLSERNFEFIRQFAGEGEPKQAKERAEEIKQKGFKCTEKEYKNLFKLLAAENSTRTPEESINALAAAWVKNGEYYRNGLLYGASKIVDELAKIPERRKEKSLASKICRYLSEWWDGQEAYCINDSIVRKVLPYYWAYYYLKDESWKNEGRTISTNYLENCTYFDFMSAVSDVKRMIEGKTVISFKDFDFFIWYSYRNDPIRREVASILSKRMQERNRIMPKRK